MKGMRTDSGLTLQQRLFVAEYLVDRDPQAAAVRAGLQRDRGPRLLAENLRVRAQIELRTEALASRIEHVAAADVVQAAAKLAFADIRKVFDDRGQLLEPSQWPDEIAQAIASVDVQTSKPRGGAVEHVAKIRTWDKTKALALLAKVMGMIEERHHHSHEITLLNVTTPTILMEMTDEEIRVLDGVVKRVFAEKKKKGRPAIGPSLPVLDAEVSS